MTREQIFNAISNERTRQDGKWGNDFDAKNTPNDWVAYLAIYVGRAVTFPWDEPTFRSAVLKLATLCVAILERDSYPPRHYDEQ